MLPVVVRKTELQTILPLRRRFLAERNVQIRYDACHRRGQADYYAFLSANEIVGYGATKAIEGELRDAIFEFYLTSQARPREDAFFRSLVETTRAAHVECQSNDPSLFSMLCSFASGITAEAVLFAEGTQTALRLPETVFRKRKDEEPVFAHGLEPVGDFVLDRRGVVVATGGFFTHYNEPFADLYFEVDPRFRNQGLGSYLLQELKRECRRAGHVAAARCNVANRASKAAMLKAGMSVCGFMLKGDLDASAHPEVKQHS